MYKMDRPGFCILPFTTLYVQENQVKLCCESEEHTQHLISKDTPISDIWNNEFYKKTRSDMIDGKLPEYCRICRLNEEAGEESKRQWDNSKAKNLFDYNDIYVNSPINYDMRPSNKCNLECVMCDGLVSTAINDRVQQYIKDTGNDDFVIATGHDWEDNRLIIEYVKQNSNNINEMKFCGGEPFLVAEVLEMLDHLVETGDCKNIDLSFITNGTVVRSKWFSEKLTRFKSVKLNISIDGVGEVGEYVRYPSKWSVVDNNIQLFKNIIKSNPQIKMSLAPVIHLLNALHMDEVIEYAAINDINIALSPVYQASNELYLSTELLTAELRQTAHDKMFSMIERYPDISFNLGRGFIKNLPQQEYMTDDKVIQQLKQVVQYWDSHRKVKFLQQYPYLEYLIK
jgi:MoaA/NifB/PqqE/SkfB family radical SAM enzyme